MIAPGHHSRRIRAPALEDYEFSIERHTNFTSGYFHAISRMPPTGPVRTWVNIDSARVDGVDESWQPFADGGVQIDNWSHEFGDLVDNFLEIDQRSHLGFFVVDYLCWFKDFTFGATCHRLDVAPEGDITRRAFRMEWPDGTRVFLMAGRRPNDGRGRAPHRVEDVHQALELARRLE